MNTIKKELFWFLFPTFIITYGLGVIAYSKGGLDSFPLMASSMYVPAIVVIILYITVFKKPLFRKNDLGIRFVGWKYWLLAPILLTILISLSFIISTLFTGEFFMNSSQIIAATEKTGLGVGSLWPNILIVFGINTLIAPLINILMFLGEELGWRAYLFPRLLRIFNPKLSFIIGGAIWGIWHSAGIFMGFNYPNNPVLGNLMMVLFCIPMGVILQYLYFKSKSIFVPALAHGAVNWTAGNFLMFVVADNDYDKMIFGPTGFIGILILMITAIFLFRKIDWQKENPYRMPIEDPAS